MDVPAPPSQFSAVQRLLADERRRQATDRDLLQAFVQRNENDAFAELLRRHGPMVLHLALHLLHHRQDAEDVYQATFLTLARKAHSLRCESSVAAWLHRVAWRLALRSRAAKRRAGGVSRLVASHQRAGHQPADAGRSPDPAEEISLRESQEILHQELAALPEHLRLPLVLCYLQGRTRDEAARRLGWSLGTLIRRLEQGRKRLHGRLSRRGVTLSAMLLASGEGSASLVESTLRLATSAVASSASVPPAVAMLLAEMSSSVKAKALWGLVLMLGASAGVSVWVSRGQSSEPAAPPEARSANNHPPADKGDKAPAPARDRFGDPLPPGALARMGTVRFRHGDTISSLALSPDDRILVTASGDRTVRLWDAATGRELRRLPGHEGRGNFDSLLAALSADGKVVATAVSSFGPIRLWDAATGKELRELQNPQWWLGHLAFSVDGKTVAAGASRHRIAVWDVATGRLIHQLDGGDKKLTFAVPIAFSPDGRLLASGGQGEEIIIWDLKKGKEQRRLTVQPPIPKEKRELPERPGLVNAVAFSPDGRTLASAAKGSPVRLWDVAAGKEVRALQGHKYGAFTLAYSPDGKMLACGEGAGTVRVWETATGKEILCIQAHKRWVSGVAFLRDGKSLMTSGDSAIRLWDIHSGAEILPDRGHSTPIETSVLSVDGRTLITASTDGGIRWWNAAIGKELRRLPCPTESLSGWGKMALSANGALAAYQTSKKVSDSESHFDIEIWDLTARKKRATLRRPNIFGAAFSPDGKVLFTPVWDVKQNAGFILSWDTATGKELRTLAKTPNGFDNISLLSADGKLLAGLVRDREKSLFLWDTATGKEVCRIPGNPEFDAFPAISADNKLLATADGPYLRIQSRTLDQHIHLWDIATGKEIGRFGRALCGYWAAAFSGDGKTLATAGEDNQIRLWETATGGERLHLSGHAGPINKLIFADNDRTLISTSSDTTALVWDITGTRRPAQVADRRRSSPSPRDLWSALADPDAAASYRAMCRLLAAPAEALALLRQHLKPIEDVDEKRIERLIADLDSDKFAVREKATEELRKVGELAEPAYRKTLASGPALEKKRRLQGLLDDISGWRPSQAILRQLRAIEVLERIASPETRALLETLGCGAVRARQTREARAALQRSRDR